MDRWVSALVVGPANAGKVALLLERYLAVLERDPWLVVPNRVDVDRVERDLLRRRPALLAGTIGTFDDLFRARRRGAGGDAAPVASEIQRTLAVRRAVERVQLNGLSSSARFAGFADTLLQAHRRARVRARRAGASSTAISPLLAAPTARSSTGSGSGTATAVRRHAVERLARRSRRLGRASRSSRTGSRT